MTKVTNFKTYKKGVDMGKHLESAMNFDSETFFKSIDIADSYIDSYKDVMSYIYTSHKLLTLYDVALIFNGLAHNREIPYEAHQVIDHICQSAGFYMIVNNELMKRRSCVYGVKANINKNKERHFHESSYRFFKAIMEEPESVTPYDVCALVLCVELLGNFEAPVYHTITMPFKRYMKVSEHDYIQNRVAYNQSLMKRYIYRPSIK